LHAVLTVEIVEIMGPTGPVAIVIARIGNFELPRLIVYGKGE
jgi:hypothetical protein